MDFFVVWDTKGAGRLVGVFDDLARAEEVVRINPNYFKLTPCNLNSVNSGIVGWALDDRERGLLTALVSQV